MPEKLRAFIAIELDKHIQEGLLLIEEKLRKSGADVKWVSHKNIHLTLKFLGYVELEISERIKNILEEAADKSCEFTMSLDHLGAFPKETSPRVIWAGANKGKKESEVLSKILEEKLQKLGIPRETRAFAAHITLGRVRSGLNRQELVKQLLEYKEIPALEFKVNKITLFKSTLTPSGSIYEALYEAKLRPA